MRNFQVAFLALAILAVSAFSADAAITFDDLDAFAVGDQVGVDTSYGIGVGGPFLMYDWAGGPSVGLRLETFCVETKEHLSGAPFTITAVDQTIPVQSSLTGRSLHAYGAWVYYKYKTGRDNPTVSVATPWDVWDDVNDTPGNAGDTTYTRTQTLGAIQYAVWWSMQGATIYSGSLLNELADLTGITTGNDLAANWVAEAATYEAILSRVGLSAADWDLTDGTAGNNVGVDVRGVTAGEGVFIYQLADHQDLLGIETVTARVPEPASLLVWSLLGAGAAGAAARRRRRWSNKNRESIQQIFDRP